MSELTDPAEVERVMLFVAIASPLMGLIFGAVLAAHKRRSLPTIIAGTLVGSLGSLAYGMWKLYGVITNAVGLGSVANLAIQFGLFAVCGAAVGIVAVKLTALLKDIS